jgi:hypothetical protein
LATLFIIGNDAIYLDAQTKTAQDIGLPNGHCAAEHNACVNSGVELALFKSKVDCFHDFTPIASTSILQYH